MSPYIIALWQTFDFWLVGVLACFTVFLYVLRRLDRSPHVTFKFHDFFTSGDWDGKASVSRLGYFGAFLTHSLIVMHQEFKSALSNEALLWYGLIWSGAAVALQYVKSKGAPSGSQTP
jgi:hypothetical protein